MGPNPDMWNRLDECHGAFGRCLMSRNIGSYVV
jgi:hypothetical protein